MDRGAAIGFWIQAIVDLHQRNFERSAERFEEAEALSPNSADLIVQHADALGHFGLAEEAWRKFERAIDLNPMPPDHYWWAGACIAFFMDRYDKSIELCGNMSNTDSVVRILAASHALQGNLAEARVFSDKVKEMYPEQGSNNIEKLIPLKHKHLGRKIVEGLRLAGI